VLDLPLDVAEQEVQAAINAATSLLPTGLPAPPIYAKVNPADTPVISFAVTSKTLPLPQVEDLADIRMAQKLSQISGVGLVSIAGGQRPSLRVQVNPPALAAYGLAIDDIRTDIINQNTNLPKGNFDGPAQNTTINDNDQMQTADEYRRLIIAYRNGAAVRLSDVATVLDGAENAELAAWANRTPAIILNVKRQPGSNVIAVVDAVKAQLPKLEQSLPPGLDVSILSDQTATMTSAPEMDRMLEQDNIDLIVLDIMLPGEDGFSICRRLRASSAIPIIMLTALDEDVDRIIGLEIGADDYVTKPFNSRELVARIRALLRRTHTGGVITRNRIRPLRFAGWRIFPRERQLYSPEGVQVTTTSAEFDLLLAFCQHPGRILSREQLLELTHGGLAGPIERSVDVHVSRIRQKIEVDPRDPVLLKTVRLGGYVFTASVEVCQ
jgi:DNA-binding response OmpR family regulator